MRKSNITIVINDPNRFYAEGIKNCVSDIVLKHKMQADYTDSAFNSRAKVLFLAEESLSVANIHYLNRRMSVRPLCIFIIKENDPDKEKPVRSHNLSHYSTLYRNQPLDNVVELIEEKIKTMRNLNSIIIPGCNTRRSNSLTRRETEILRYLARGISNGGVARYLHISEKTVSAHKRNIMSKLNMVRPAELNYWLIQEGWCESSRNV